MSRPFKLYRLQQIDSQLDWLHTRILELDALLKDDAELKQAIASVTQAEERLKDARKAVHRAEDDVRQQRLKIEQNEASLYGGKIRNPKELKDLENEVAALKRYLRVLEDRQLEAMLTEEEASSLHEITVTELGRVQAIVEQRSQNANEEKNKLNKDAARLEEERKATLSSISPEDLALYTQLRQKRRGVAVAKVVDRTCAACGSTLSAALLNNAHSPNQISLCETCGRVLYIG
jgi:uncharacterized protein